MSPMPRHKSAIGVWPPIPKAFPPNQNRIMSHRKSIISIILRIARPLPPARSKLKHQYGNGRKHKPDASQDGDAEAPAEPVGEGFRGERENSAHEAAEDDDGGHAGGRVETAGVDDVGVEGQVDEHLGGAEQADDEEQHGHRQVQLRGPAVRRDAQGQGEGAHDDHGEPVLGRADAPVPLAQPDVDLVEKSVHEDHADG